MRTSVQQSAFSTSFIYEHNAHTIGPPCVDEWYLFVTPVPGFETFGVVNWGGFSLIPPAPDPLQDGTWDQLIREASQQPLATDPEFAPIYPSNGPLFKDVTRHEPIPFWRIAGGSEPFPCRRANLQKSNAIDDWKRLQCTGTAVTGRYENYAEGFAIRLPRGLSGRRDQAGGPERGFSIPLSPDCEAVIVVSGSANALEWTSPDHAIAWEIEMAMQAGRGVGVTRYASKLGNLRAAAVTLRSDRTADVDDVVVAFRPGGDRVYVARLSTTAARYREDRESFARILRRFQLEARRAVPAPPDAARWPDSPAAITRPWQPPSTW